VKQERKHETSARTIAIRYFWPSEHEGFSLGELQVRPWVRKFVESRTHRRASITLARREVTEIIAKAML
jgi:hypothetical protein